MTIEEIKQRLDFLSDKIDLINSNLQFNINTFLAILALAIAITGVALVLLVKNVVNKRVEIELNKNIEKLKENIIKEITYEDSKIELVPFNGWASLDCCQRLVCWKDKKGYTNIEGILEGVLTEKGIGLFNIPIEYAPSDNITMIVITDYKIGKIKINIDGMVTIEDIDNRRHIEINIKFKAKN